jgi:UDP-glucose 4-epimerase
MRSLVTGGCGFIGSHVARHCRDLGHDVVVLDDLSGGFRDHLPDGVRLVEGSVTDHALVDRLVAEHRPETIYHLAAYAAEGLSHFIRRFNYETNLIGTANLLNAAVNVGTVGRFVFTSSIAVYGAGQVPMTEDTEPRPEDPYGVAKYAAELDLWAAHALWGLDVTVFRPHNVYGEHQNLGDRYRNVIGIFMNQLLRGEPMTIFGDGSQTRAFSHVDDVAPVIAGSVDVPAARNATFNVGADEATSGARAGAPGGRGVRGGAAGGAPRRAPRGGARRRVARPRPARVRRPADRPAARGRGSHGHLGPDRRRASRRGRSPPSRCAAACRRAGSRRSTRSRSDRVEAAQDPDERFDVVDEDGRPTGRVKRRADVHRDGDWHRAVHVWVAGRGPDAQAFLLFQRRGLGKDTWPGRLDATVGGHLRAGEDVRQALREVEEEIGVVADPTVLLPLGRRRVVHEHAGVSDRELQDVLLLVDDRPLTAYRPQRAEVAALVRFDLRDLRPSRPPSTPPRSARCWGRTVRRRRGSGSRAATASRMLTATTGASWPRSPRPCPPTSRSRAEASAHDGAPGLRRHLAQSLGELPVVPLRVLDPVAPVAVGLVLGSSRTATPSSLAVAKCASTSST